MFVHAYKETNKFLINGKLYLHFQGNKRALNKREWLASSELCSIDQEDQLPCLQDWEDPMESFASADQNTQMKLFIDNFLH